MPTITLVLPPVEGPPGRHCPICAEQKDRACWAPSRAVTYDDGVEMGFIWRHLPDRCEVFTGYTGHPFMFSAQQIARYILRPGDRGHSETAPFEPPEVRPLGNVNDLLAQTCKGGDDDDG